MKENYFELRCSINHAENGQLSLKIPSSCYADFVRTIEGRKDEDMKNLVEIFGEFSNFDNVKRQTYQALILARADDVSTLSDLVDLLKFVRLCDAFDPKK